MGSARVKTQVYFLVISLIASLLGVAVVWLGHGGPPANAPSAVTPIQKLKALEKAAPQSPEMRRFLQRELAAQQANQNAADALPQ